MRSMLHSMRVVFAAAALTAAALGGGPAPPALAGGDPGPPPLTFSPDSFGVTPQGEAVVGGTLSCAAPAWAVASAFVTQDVGRVGTLYGEGWTYVECPEPGGVAVSITVPAGAQRGFRPGTATISLDVFGCTLPDPDGVATCGDQYGVLTRDLHPTR